MYIIKRCKTIRNQFYSQNGKDWLIRSDMTETNKAKAIISKGKCRLLIALMFNSAKLMKQSCYSSFGISEKTY